MALKLKVPKLKINQLILIGKRKNYVVSFESGLNIIYGDSDTGKSSILNLINYCLGSTRLDLYDEIEVTGQYCLLEIELRGEIYTIKRDIFNSSEEIEVYHGSYNQVENLFPKYFSPNYRQQSEDGVFSEFLLESMNLPITKIKQAPSKPDSPMVTLSFRDIFKYNFLDQDQIGNKKIFGDNPVMLVKLKETFKLMFKVLDNQILQLEQAIAEKHNRKQDLNKNLISVTSFLKQTEVQSLSEIVQTKEILESELAETRQDLQNLDIEIIRDSEDLNSLRENIQTSEIELAELSHEIGNKTQEVRQIISLKNEYSNDTRKIGATLEALKKIPKIKEKMVECPVCDQHINLSFLKSHFLDSSESDIKGELNNVRRRSRQLDEVYKNLKSSLEEDEKRAQEITLELQELRYVLDQQSKNIVSPFIQRRDILSYRMGTIASELSNLKHFHKIRLQQSVDTSEIADIDTQISELREDLRNLKDSAPSVDHILNDLGNDLKKFLDFVGVKNTYGVSISEKTFLPKLRDKDYERLTSGGVRTLTSVGYFLSILKYATEHSVNYPSILMIDTIAKYIGKTKEKDLAFTDLKEDKLEGMTDATKYENIYKYLMDLNRSANSFQLIVVDNDLPTNMINSLQPYVRKHFTVNPASGISEIGFINDAPPIVDENHIDEKPFNLENLNIEDYPFDDTQ